MASKIVKVKETEEFRRVLRRRVRAYSVPLVISSEVLITKIDLCLEMLKVKK